MKNLELILPTNERLSFNLGDSPDFLSGIEELDTIDIDKEMHRAYWIYHKKYGMEFIFKDNQLKAFFLYGVEPINKGFCGSFSLLPKQYFKGFDKEQFIAYLQEQGFIEYPKKYPFSIDMLNDKYRIRYYERPDNSYIMIDSGNKLRELLSNE